MGSTATGMKFASAITDEPDSQAACEQILEQLGTQVSGAVDLVLLFTSRHHMAHWPRISKAIHQAISPRVLLGSTAKGVVGPAREIERAAGMSVMAAQLPTATLRPFVFQQQIDWTPPTQPNGMPDVFASDPQQVKAGIVLADPFSTPATALLGALNESLPGVPIVGGMASAGRRPGENRLLINGRIIRDGAVGVTLAGDLDVQCSVSQGCRPIGRPMVITRAHRHMIQQLGGRRALDVVRKMAQRLNLRDRQLVKTHGLLVGRVINEYKSHFGRGDFLIRNVVGFEQETGSIAIGDSQVRVGQTIQFHVRDRRTAEEDMDLLLGAQSLYGPPAGALLFTCTGRGKRLFKRAHADAGAISRTMGDVPLAGIFAQGEIGPIADHNWLHGQTASLMAFREQPAQQA